MPVKSFTGDSQEIHTPAKINLFLQVLNKRPDGYHNINSLFQAVTLFDILNFKKIPESVCRIKVVGSKGIEIKDNLISRAFELMKSGFNFEDGVEVTLEKRIPLAAGLGGGSSDCAATIIGINRVFKLRLSNVAMARIGLELGSDVPFFFSNGQALVTGRGEIIEETAFPTNYRLVLVTPALGLSTKEAYAALKMDLTCHQSPFNLKDSKNLEDFFKSLSLVGNDFEKVQFRKHPKLGEIKERLINCGARWARMSGSGPTIFGVFPENIDTERVCANNFVGCQLHTVEPFCLQ